MEEFKKELKALLIKYDASICLDFDDCSDTHGMTGVQMVAVVDGKEVFLSYDYGIDACDL
jgi:hypothetical protein